MVIYDRARGDLERDKFVEDTSGNVAVNVKIADALPISLTGDVQIGAVEIKDSGTDRRTSVNTSGEMGVYVGNFPIVQTTSVNNFPVVQNILGTTSVSNFPDTQNVSVSNFPATQSVSVVNSILSVSDGSIIAQLEVLNSLIPEKYDYITCGYDTSSYLTSAVFKINGSTGSTISTLALVNDTAGNVLSVTKT